MPVGFDALYMLTVTWALLGQTCENVFIFRTKPDSHSDSIDEEVNFLINDTVDWILTPMRDSMSSNCLLIGSRIVTLNPPLSPMAERFFIGVTGAIASDSLPSYCAGVIALKTGLSGRRLNGRCYVPGIPFSSLNGNDFTDARRTILQHAGDSMVNRYGRDGTSNRVWGGVYSRKNGVTRSPGPPPTLHYLSETHVPWRTASARRPIFTNRHRLEGRGI